MNNKHKRFLPHAKAGEHMKIFFSRASDEWATPHCFFDRCAKEFGPFDLDPCATAQNAKAARYFTQADNGLAQPWAPARVWMNPPYGRVIGAWMRKAWEESRRGAFVVCLVPARTDTVWWHEYAIRGQVRFLRGRLVFDGARHPAPFPSALIVFYPSETRIANTTLQSTIKP
jgi:site-specific DNA-methyltransferase (adenine-specific)